MLSAELRAVFDRFITTEYVTIDGRGQPIAWPVTPYPHEENGHVCLDVTTGLGYPKKARDAQRNPKVALLFSEPHGSGLTDPPTVLVQGTARVDEDDLAANRERYRREGRAKLPKANEKAPPPSMDRFMSWYVDRIYVHVVPQRVLVWRNGGEPEIVLDELPAGEAPPSQPLGGVPLWDERIEQLGTQYTTAVLALVGADGFPLAARVGVRADRAAGLVRIEATPAGIPLAPGRACITAHAHGPEFEWQRNFQVRGELVEADGGWALRPHKLVGGFELPENQLAILRENFRKVMRYRKIARAELKKRRTPA
ncbi:MAG TPA: pyridoxamine 5'-phosphate oxidase family protein [Solirubrobacteraceae bacterium]|nr:pyridoxamine 5'-phosphate oxidase family protein [Solirubrobacteraceae bacterium]